MALSSATARESPHSIPEIIDTRTIEIPEISVKMQVVCGNKIRWYNLPDNVSTTDTSSEET